MQKIAIETYFFKLYFILQLYFTSDEELLKNYSKKVFEQIYKPDRVYGFSITQLKVPMLVDPRDSLALGCEYNMGSEELYSVKWYKDEQEFFRYTPRQQPHVLGFPAAGVHLAQPQQPTHCDEQQCNVLLTRLSTAHSSGAYKCEVSTEAPKFRRDFRVANVTVAAVGRTAPQIQGVRATYSVAELVQAQCTAAAADPQPMLTWLLNGAPAPAAGQQRSSTPDLHGLVTATLDLRFHTEPKHFPPPEHQLHVVCVATPPPSVPAPALTSQPAIARLVDPVNQQGQRNVLGNQKLEWLKSKASLHSLHQGHLCTMVLVVFCCWR